MSAGLRDISPARIAGMIAVIGTLVASALHVVFGMRAGALWRDEVNSLELATVPVFRDVDDLRLQFFSRALLSRPAHVCRAFQLPPAMWNCARSA